MTRTRLFHPDGTIGRKHDQPTSIVLRHQPNDIQRPRRSILLNGIPTNDVPQSADRTIDDIAILVEEQLRAI